MNKAGATVGSWRSTVKDALHYHWPEYVIEAAGLGCFMIAAGVLATIIELPTSPVRLAITGAVWRRVLLGSGVGLTAVLIIYSRWGKRSGAHLNPAVTLSFFLLGKVAGWDACFYVVAQAVGGLLGVLATAGVLGTWFSDPPIHYIVTVPGARGVGVAFVAEFSMAFALMTMVLVMSNERDLAPFTGLAAGVLLALFIVVGAPLSGMSINPARTLASAWPAHFWQGVWIYVVAPTTGMMSSAFAYVQVRTSAAVRCAKLQHDRVHPCIFRCGYAAISPEVSEPRLVTE
jgi:aquaporin Z